MKHDQNYGMKALWAYVRSLGPLGGRDNSNLQTMKNALELLEGESPAKVHMARSLLRDKIKELEGTK